MRIIGAIAGIIFVVFSIFSACSPKSSQEDYDTSDEENIAYEYEYYDSISEIEDLKQEVELLRDDLENAEYSLEEYEENFGMKIDGSEYYHKFVDYCDTVMNSSTFDFYDTSTYSIVYLDAVDRALCPDCYNLRKKN